MKLHYDFKSIKDVKAKWDAAAELFGNENVSVCLTGTWRDKNGDAVFFDYTDSEPVDHISPVYIYVDVDGEMTGLTGTGKSGYKLHVSQ